MENAERKNLGYVLCETRLYEKTRDEKTINDVCNYVEELVNSMTYNAHEIYKDVATTSGALSGENMKMLTQMAFAFVATMVKHPNNVDGRNEYAMQICLQICKAFDNGPAYLHSGVKSPLPEWETYGYSKKTKSISDEVLFPMCVEKFSRRSIEKLPSDFTLAEIIGMYMASGRVHKTLQQNFASLMFYHLCHMKGNLENTFVYMYVMGDLDSDFWIC